MSRFPWSYLVALAALVVWLYILSGVGRDKYELDPSLLSSLSARVDSLQQAVDQENRVLEELRRKAEKEESAYRDLEAQLRAREKDLNLDHLSALSSSSAGAWPDPIPVLVFACNRKDAVKNHLEQLIRLRPSAERFPIIVSQDCDDAGVAATVKEFGDKVQYIKHVPGAKANISVPVEHRQYTTYYMIARHYKLALDYVFGEKKYGSVIITEDDLDVAVDFFEYFSATRHLLDKDKTLWCVQAWNDNGRPSSIRVEEADRLYRADFFSGLGWMMTSSLWSELSPIWPRGFWDDWLRDPARRKERVCIRPEVSRTGMSAHGKKGASVGRFFSKYLSTVLVNQKSVSFTKMDLSYLEKYKFDRQWEKTVYEDAELLSIEDAMTRTLQGGGGDGRAIRVEYNANLDYIQKADKLHIMHDFKAGVPRTAYNGVVSCVVNGVRVYLARDRKTVKEYDPKWEVPSWISD